MQLPTLPKWMRSQQPAPLIDSPFPPLNPDRRYKGVYERAGFDVNLTALHSPVLRQLVQKVKTDQITLSLKTPVSVTENYPSLQASPYSPYLQKHPRSTRSSELKKDHQNNKNSKALQPPDYSQEQGSLFGQNYSCTLNYLNNRYSHRSSDSRAYKNDSFKSATSSTLRQRSIDSHNRSQHSAALSFYLQEPPYQSFQAFHPSHNKNERLQNILADDDFEPLNKKSLKLDIQNINFFQSDSGSMRSYQHQKDKRIRTYEEAHENTNTGAENLRNDNVRFCMTNTSSRRSTTGVMKGEVMQSAPYPTKEYDQLYTPASEKHLSSVLADLRHEVEEHRALPKGSICRFPNRVLFQLAHEKDDESLHDDLSLRSPLRDSDETGNSTVDDFHQMLSEQKRKNETSPYSKTNNRKNHEEGLNVSGSRLSTISSVLSRNDCPSDADNEIERELERQLECLKTGSKLSLDIRHKESNVTVSGNIFGTAGGSVGGSASVIYITDAESSHSKTSLNTSLRDAVTPLFACKNRAYFGLVNEPSTPRVKLEEFRNNPCDTPETIEPMSSKTHRLALELQELNFHDHSQIDLRLAQNFDSSDSSACVAPLEDEEILSRSEEEILSANVPQEFDAFPRSVIDPSLPVFRASAGQVLSGAGPCRTCKKRVDPMARGLMKRIFSRSGELSGQWHRACFRCSWQLCPLIFNKNDVPYVLLDNAFCYHHYHLLNDTLCSSCGRGIEGECIENELKQKWHSQCLCCTRCSYAIKDDYFCVNSDIYCARDAIIVLAERERLGLLTSDRVEKRRTRLMYLDQGPGF